MYVSNSQAAIYQVSKLKMKCFWEPEIQFFSLE